MGRFFAGIHIGLWPKFSGLFFLAIFLFIVWRVYRPAKRTEMESYGKYPLKD